MKKVYISNKTSLTSYKFKCNIYIYISKLNQLAWNWDKWDFYKLQKIAMPIKIM